ncbi:calcium-binding protein [Jannaschia aquimarina]|uniref:EF hand n=1 Tax=Jannaschia aquimarina TaxID=935700 RepID=A0A0D1CRE9_9RHOB|nr:calcium-binding protein [Jannaschia aquimarina]KIT17342.1 EF hand [Jannaschia aquimarina]SNT20599.1 EF hand [Jannaschia aquimarina]
MKTIVTKIAAILAVTFAVTSPAAAQDTDGDGAVSLEEFQAAYPDATAETFTAADTDADGVLSEAEMAAAIDAGLIPS